MNLVDNVKFNGNKLYDIRREKKISQAKLAKALNVSRQTIYLWESNQSLPSIEKVGRICKFLGINLSDLIDGVTEEKVEEYGSIELNQNEMNKFKNMQNKLKKEVDDKMILDINNKNSKIIKQMDTRRSEKKKSTKVIILILILIIVIYTIISNIKFVRLNILINKWNELNKLDSYYIKEIRVIENKNENANMIFERKYYEKYYSNGIMKTVYRNQENENIETVIIDDYNEKTKYVINVLTKTYKRTALNKNSFKMTDNFEIQFFKSTNSFVNYLYCFNPFFKISYNEVYELKFGDNEKEYIEKTTGLLKYKENIDKDAQKTLRYYEYELNTGKDFEINLDEYTDVTGQN